MKGIILSFLLIISSCVFGQFNRDSLSGNISIAPYSFTSGVLAREFATMHGMGLQAQIYYQKLYGFAHYTTSYANEADSEADVISSGVLKMDSRLKFQHSMIAAGYNFNPLYRGVNTHRLSGFVDYTGTLNALGKGSYEYLLDSTGLYTNYRLERHCLGVGLNWNKRIPKVKTLVNQNLSVAVNYGADIYTKGHRRDSTSYDYAYIGRGEMKVNSPIGCTVYYDRSWYFSSGHGIKAYAIANYLPAIYLQDGIEPRGGTPAHFFVNIGVAWSFKGRT